jgi:hypothetical protein
MALERVKQFVSEARELAAKVEQAIDDRPVLEAAIEALRSKLAEVDDALDEEPA